MNYSTVSFSDVYCWRSVLLMGILFGSLLLANIIKKAVPFMKRSLIPNAVLGGIIVLVISGICYSSTGNYLFDLPAFSENGSGMTTLEILTYHCLALGFIALTLRPGKQKLTKERSVEVFNSSCITITNYLAQGIFGLAVTIVAFYAIGMAPGSGLLLSFGYGQGTGQALSQGKNIDVAINSNDYASVGLTLAAMGFLVASIGGVLYLNYLRSKGRLKDRSQLQSRNVSVEQVESENEVPVNESIDRLTIQVALVLLAYVIAYGMMYLLGTVLLGEGSSFCGTIYGFNFIFGVLAAVIVKNVMKLLQKAGIIKREYINTYLLNRISGFCFDLMVVSGICAIRLHLLRDYIFWILVLGIGGALLTLFYVKYSCRVLFPEYENEQFLAFFGMLTGTASTGMILLREADPDLTSPVSDNLVYQNFPSIIMALPLLIIAGKVTSDPMDPQTAFIMALALFAFFAVLNLVMFRKQIKNLFAKKKKAQ